MPAANYVQEAVNLKMWASEDKEELIAAKIGGQYLFYKNKKRYVGYTSKYLREHRQKSPVKPPEKAETVTA